MCPRQVESPRPPSRTTASPVPESFDVLMLSAHMVSSVLLFGYFSGVLPALGEVRAETLLLCAKWVAEMCTVPITPDLLLHHVIMFMAAAGVHAFPIAAFLVVHVQVHRLQRARTSFRLFAAREDFSCRLLAARKDCCARRQDARFEIRLCGAISTSAALAQH